MVLTGQQIQEQRIITDAINEEVQTQSCGIDLTVAKIEAYASAGEVDFDNSKRKLPRMQDAGKFRDTWQLPAGSYLVSFNETLNIPEDSAGFAWPRSTLLRLGATMCTAVFDPGYIGKPKCCLIVFNKNGMTVHQNARLAQIVFLPLSKAAEKLYTGQYQNEGVSL